MSHCKIDLGNLVGVWYVIFKRSSSYQKSNILKVLFRSDITQFLLFGLLKLIKMAIFSLKRPIGKSPIIINTLVKKKEKKIFSLYEVKWLVYEEEDRFQGGLSDAIPTN